MLGLGRRLRKTFGISAPRMAVRTQLSWRWRLPALAALLLAISGMWWWGFDFGQLLGGFNRGEVRARIEKLETDNAGLRTANAALKKRQNELESELNMALGASNSLTQQALALQGENTQIKEQLAFLQRLVDETGEAGSFTIQRLSAKRQGDAAYHFSALLVRGGNPADEFVGRLSLQAELVASGHPVSLSLPEDDPGAARALALKFKRYQQVDGVFRVPAGSELKNLEARVLEPGHAKPRVVRSLTLP